MTENEPMTESEQITRARRLILDGMPVYQAIQEVGMSMHRWYRITNGEDRLLRTRRLKRLQAKRDKLLIEIAKIEKEMSGCGCNAFSQAPCGRPECVHVPQKAAPTSHPDGWTDGCDYCITSTAVNGRKYPCRFHIQNCLHKEEFMSVGLRYCKTCGIGLDPQNQPPGPHAASSNNGVWCVICRYPVKDPIHLTVGAG